MPGRPRRNHLKTWTYYSGILVILGALIWTLWIGIVMNPALEARWWLTGDEELLSRKMNINFEAEPFEKAVDSIISELNEGKAPFRKWRYSIDSPKADELAKEAITLRLSNVPLSVALRYASNLNQLKYELKGRRKIVFRELSSSNLKMIQSKFNLHERKLGDWIFPGYTGNGPHDVVSNLERVGVSFGKDTYAKYYRGKSKLVVRNTEDQCELIEAFFDSAHIYREPTTYEYITWMIQDFFASKLSSPPSPVLSPVPASPSPFSAGSDPFGAGEPDPFGP